MRGAHLRYILLDFVGPTLSATQSSWATMAAGQANQEGALWVTRLQRRQVAASRHAPCDHNNNNNSGAQTTKTTQWGRAKTDSDRKCGPEAEVARRFSRAGLTRRTRVSRWRQEAASELSSGLFSVRLDGQQPNSYRRPSKKKEHRHSCGTTTPAPTATGVFQRTRWFQQQVGEQTKSHGQHLHTTGAKRQLDPTDAVGPTSGAVISEASSVGS